MREVTFLPWDSELFDCSIARLDGAHRDRAGLEPALAACIAERVACAYCLVPAVDLEAIRAVEDAGFRLVDQRITLARHGAISPTAGEDLTHEVAKTTREASAEDVPALQALAAVSHTDTRFFAHPRFARERCAELYRLWIKKSCLEGYADVVLTEGPTGDPAGYP
jgi:hypothetical protein